MVANHRFMIGEHRLHVCLIVKHHLQVCMALRALKANGDQPSLHYWLEHAFGLKRMRPVAFLAPFSPRTISNIQFTRICYFFTLNILINSPYSEDSGVRFYLGTFPTILKCQKCQKKQARPWLRGGCLIRMAAGGDIHSYSGAAVCKVKLCWEFLCFIKMRNDNNSVCSFIHLNCKIKLALEILVCTPTRMCLRTLWILNFIS